MHYLSTYIKFFLLTPTLTPTLTLGEYPGGNQNFSLAPMTSNFSNFIVELIASKRNKENALFKDFVYKFDTSNENISHWICIKRS
jgi:hypothetical protein